jgi:hypothetical protein
MQLYALRTTTLLCFTSVPVYGDDGPDWIASSTKHDRFVFHVDDPKTSGAIGGERRALRFAAARYELLWFAGYSGARGAHLHVGALCL